MNPMNSHWVPGNRITLLENGEGFYPRVFDSIGAAEHEALLETFILFDDKVGRALQQALLRAASRGAKVDVLVDGWGSPDLPSSFVQPLQEAGVRLRSFEPVQRLFGTRVNMLRRMHRKLVVVDGRRAFVGGINYSADHLADFGPLAKQDYAVEIEGPLVGQIQAFCRASLAAPQPTRRLWLPKWRLGRVRDDEVAPSDDADMASEDGARAAFVTRDNRSHRNDIERHYRAAVRTARHRVLIANAYFFPGYRLLRDLRRAAGRGVQVDLVLQGRPDQAWVQRASELLYGYLMRAGVCVHLYDERPLHAKVAVVDDRWATVGSSNLDPTSLSLNLEANIVVRDSAFATQLRERIECLMQQRCQLVRLPMPGPLRSAWIALRSLVVYHAMRHFAAWVRHAPDGAPRVVPLQADRW
ncbi:cardiolipin synthase ClsB [uncultured Piscinibacter sp.]|uniref:cardiolipin synthase ClsB n=1 Tax=uncultured Piscinibacter sp. TaxID=1131835 RepID=UPI002622C3F2|nr:cardiolipin synthase ClsB [uncultured Piscinibacter sp.]